MRYNIFIIQKKRCQRKRNIGAAERPFKLDTRDRFLMLLAYYRLYITYALYSFLFDLDQSNICRDIQKIKPLLIRNCLPIQQKIYNITKRLNTLEDFETHFPSFLSFIFCLSYSVFHILSFIFCLSQIPQNSQYQDLQIIKEERYTIQVRGKDIDYG